MTITFVNLYRLTRFILILSSNVNRTEIYIVDMKKKRKTREQREIKEQKGKKDEEKSSGRHVSSLPKNIETQKLN